MIQRSTPVSGLITPPVGGPEQSPRMLRTEHKTLAADMPRLPFCTFKHHRDVQSPAFSPQGPSLHCDMDGRLCTDGELENSRILALECHIIQFQSLSYTEDEIGI